MLPVKANAAMMASSPPRTNHEDEDDACYTHGTRQCGQGPLRGRSEPLKLEEEIRHKILSMSAATIDRLLQMPRRTMRTGNIPGEAVGNKIT